MKYLLATVAILFATSALAEPQQINCPTPGQSCKILFLSQNDINMLLGERGVLPTAAQARAIDLAGYVTFFATEIAKAQDGVVMPVKPPESALKKEDRVEPDKK